MPKLTELNLLIYLTVSESKTDLSSLILPLHMIHTLGPWVRERKTKWATFFKTSFSAKRVVQEWCLRLATYFSGWAAENCIWGPSPFMWCLCLFPHYLMLDRRPRGWCPLLNTADFWQVCNGAVSSSCFPSEKFIYSCSLEPTINQRYLGIWKVFRKNLKEIESQLQHGHKAQIGF